MREIRTFTKPKAPDGIRENWIFSRTTPKARKDYACNACGEAIPKGTRYVAQVTVALEGPGWERWRTHGECFLEGLSLCAGAKRPEWRWTADA